MTTTNSPEAQPQGGERLTIKICSRCGLQNEAPVCVCGCAAMSRVDYVRADLPRATAADDSLLTALKAAANYICRAQSDYYDAETRDMVIKALTYEINELERTPCATGETTVETALVELREMFPKTFIRVRSTTEIEYNEYADKASYRERHAYVLIMKHGEFSAQTLADCMAKVRAATRTEGEESSERSL